VLLITQEIRDAISNNMPKDKLRNLVYNTDVNTLLQDGLEKVINGYTTFEEVIKLIELDDDIDDKMDAYKYNLDNALEQTEISKTNQINLGDIKKAAENIAVNENLYKPQDQLEKTQILDILDI